MRVRSLTSRKSAHSHNRAASARAHASQQTSSLMPPPKLCERRFRPAQIRHRVGPCERRARVGGVVSLPASVPPPHNNSGLMGRSACAPPYTRSSAVFLVGIVVVFLVVGGEGAEGLRERR